MLPNHLSKNPLIKSLLNLENSLFRILLVRNVKTAISNQNHVNIEENSSKVFFSPPAQTLMKKLTGFDLDKMNKTHYASNSNRNTIYKFMTTEQLKQAQKFAINNALQKLQLPPIVPVNKKETEILEDVPELIGLSQSKYVFTDITYNLSDRNRLIVVREPTGVLRKANPQERHRMNHIYFPKLGREYRQPKMFQKENLERLWQEKEYEFVLDRACCQFEPDDQEFHDVTFQTYKVINDNRDFKLLKSTRHYGTLVFYLCLTKNLANLMREYLENDHLEDAINVIHLYGLIHSNSGISPPNLNTKEEKVMLIQSFVEKEMENVELLKNLIDNIKLQLEKEKQEETIEEE